MHSKIIFDIQETVHFSFHFIVYHNYHNKHRIVPNKIKCVQQQQCKVYQCTVGNEAVVSSNCSSSSVHRTVSRDGCESEEWPAEFCVYTYSSVALICDQGWERKVSANKTGFINVNISVILNNISCLWNMFLSGLWLFHFFHFYRIFCVMFWKIKKEIKDESISKSFYGWFEWML